MVLPSISPLSDGVRVASTPVDISPPLNFRPLRGPITNVHLGAQRSLSHRISSEMSLAKIAGLKYEKSFLDYLSTKQPRLAIQPHIHFQDDGTYRTIIPDAVLVEDTRCVVFEVKIQHMPEAWWQLHELYLPVLSTLFFDREVRGVEICRRYDPQLRWPEQHVIYNDLDDAIAGVSPLGVLKWKQT